MKSWGYLNIGDFCVFKSKDKIIVIDVTNSPWKKQLGSISNQDETQVDGVKNIIQCYLYHCRCKNSIIIKGNSIYCEKCRSIIPSKSICFKSPLKNRFLKLKNIIIGEALIENDDKPMILIDLEYSRRNEKV